MKKFFAGMMTAMLLVAAMGTTVFAATSPTSQTALKNLADLNNQATSMNNKVTGVENVSTSANKNITVTPEKVTATVMGQGNAYNEKNFGSEYSLLAMTDLSVPAGTDTSKGVTVKLRVDENLGGLTLRVLHQTDSGTWENLTINETGTDYVVFTMTSFSPVMLVRVWGTAANNSTTTSTTTTTSSSPTYIYYTTPSTSSTTNSGTTDSDTTDTKTSDTEGTASASSHNDSSATDQKVSVGTTDNGTYGQGYSDGYAAGAASVNSAAKESATKDSATKDSATADSTKTEPAATGTNAVGTTVIRTVGSTSGNNLSTTSPKTGASLPTLPILAVFAFAGILVCGKKAQNQ
jgi:hypothetical protein